MAVCISSIYAEQQTYVQEFADRYLFEVNEKLPFESINISEVLQNICDVVLASSPALNPMGETWILSSCDKGDPSYLLMQGGEGELPYFKPLPFNGVKVAIDQETIVVITDKGAVEGWDLDGIANSKTPKWTIACPWQDNPERTYRNCPQRTATKIHVARSGLYWIGTTVGMYVIDGGKPLDFGFMRQRDNGTIFSIASNFTDPRKPEVVFGTKQSECETRLWSVHIDPQEDTLNWNYQYEWAMGIVEDTPTALVYVNDTLWIGNSATINLRHADGTYTRFGGHHLLHDDSRGLPLGSITDMILQDGLDGHPGYVWVSHSFNGTGAVSRCDLATMEWRFFRGHRWLTDDSVKMFAQHSSHRIEMGTSLLALTETGLSMFRLKEYDLRTKAENIQAIAYPRHDRMGLVAIAGLSRYGNLTKWGVTATDNDGLWTSMYAVGLGFKYAMDKDPRTLR